MTRSGIVRRIALLSALACLWRATPLSGEGEASPAPVRFQAPEFLTFEELKTLAGDPYPEGPIRQKYQALWREPIISNEAHERGAQPHRPSSAQLGPFLRVVSWNIEKSIELDAVIEAFTDPEAFAQRIEPRRAKPGSRRHRRVMAERALLEEADVIVLQEMDIGMKRSGYRDAARDLAQELDMNYAYLPIQVEVDPVLLGMEDVRTAQGLPDTEATAHFREEADRYRGLFGVAVLSRYPILSARGFPLFTQGYDWYWLERRKLSFLERARRFGARQVFGKAPHREIKLGGRCYFRVDLHVPDLPEARVSVINVHLEIKATPEARAAQMAEILNYIREIPHPVILAGDFNSAPEDLSPTSTPRAIERTLAAPEFWLSRAIEYLSPYALTLNATRFLSNLTKNYQNPTGLHVPLVLPNPSAELFRLIERFRFRDGGAFDFRGTRRRSAGRIGLLSNSNERDVWAYKTTFRVTRRTITNWVGTYRLDWIFVKAYATHPRRRRQPYRLAPHLGRTLNTLNRALRVPISDHDPNVVDLPLLEPPAAGD